MPPQLMVERFPTILRDKHHMILAVPRGMAESLAVWHDKLPLGSTLSGSPEGVCRFASRNCQTLGVPRQSRGFTLIKLNGIFAPVSVGAPPGAPPTWTPHHILVLLFPSSSLLKYFACILLICVV